MVPVARAFPARRMSARVTLAALLGAGLLSVALLTALQAAPDSPVALGQRADKLFEDKNYKEAAAAYEAAIQATPKTDLAQHAVQRLITSKLRLGLFDDALDAAQAHVARCAGTLWEARAERFAGNLYTAVPHWGTRAGGKFYRAENRQGIGMRSERHDKRIAIAHLERARGLYAKYDADPASLPEAERGRWREERIECLFDLAGACSRFGVYENDWRFWYAFWAERDDAAAETAGDTDFEETRSTWQLQRKRPIGLRLDAAGKPLFPSTPTAYAPALSDDEKILFLLKEVRDLDTTDVGAHAARSYYRQAMLARARFGMDRVNAFAGYYREGARQPLREELDKINPWEMAPNQAIVLAGGQLVVADLPREWDVVSLLRTTFADHGRSGQAAEARYALGLYFQTRQQYTQALQEHEAVLREFPKSQAALGAQAQIQRITGPEAQLAATGLYLPGSPPAVKFSHRNVKRVWFVARPVDLKGFFEDVRDLSFDEDRGVPELWRMDSWSALFTNGYNPQPRDRAAQLAAKRLGPEAARWSVDVNDDGTYRYAKAETDAPFKDPGVWLVQAFTQEPPANSASKSGEEALVLGSSRAVVAISDLAFIEKRTAKGKLYFVVDARTGAPVPGARITAFEVWSEYSRLWRRNNYYRETREITTDQDGLAFLQEPQHQRGNLHLFVDAGQARMAWSGMSYWSFYSPSPRQDGYIAYCVTDRPVYRPAHTVRYKVWVRQGVEGEYRTPTGQSVSIEVRDPRGDVVHSASKQADSFGAVDGEFVLDAEARLGTYNVRFNGGHCSFRVEEYRKPEYEVTVEPSKSHARLGDRLSARIKAAYYFGAPVTGASVRYRVFREEFAFSYWFPGPWDWLYGPGYGLPWYDAPWFPWYAGCRFAPGWWGGVSVPVRELVSQGSGATDKDGLLSVEIDTGPALKAHPDRDHRYVVEAEVTDASRRVIAGQGAVVATRQSFYAVVQPDLGYIVPGQEVLVRVRLMTPDRKPLKAEGMVTVSSIVAGGRGNLQVGETVLRQWRASTDEEGQLQFPLSHDKSGQVRVSFETPDSWGGTVTGHALLWVCGRDFDGEIHRFNDLELITDKRTYRPGETARVMINTARSGSTVLFSDSVDNGALLSWRVLKIPRRSLIVDVPIREGHKPNFFVEAATVSDQRAHEQSAQICVPPEGAVLNVQVAMDKPSYRPGEQARVSIKATAFDGKPVQAQFALSAFDRSVLYIQPETAPPIAKFFHGALRNHTAAGQTNLSQTYGAWSPRLQPFLINWPLPSGWQGFWGPEVKDWRDVQGLNMDFGDNSSLRAAKSETAKSMAEGYAMDLSRAKEIAPASGPPEAKSRNAATAEPPALVEATVRTRFADTALWLPSLVTNADGVASAAFNMPENLTTWKLNAWGATTEVRVGQAETTAVTTKNLLVRLQAPRFFMERDEVVLSANAHNYLARAKTVRVSLELPADLLQLAPGAPAVREIVVPPGEDRRVDWRVTVLKAGKAAIGVKALTDEESDAMSMTFPVLTHGFTRQVSRTGSMRPDDIARTATVEIDAPEQRRPELTRLEVRFTPSLIGAMLDAVPYCLDHPYWTNDHTVCRFVPAVLTLRTLQSLGIRLDDLRQARGRLAEVRAYQSRSLPTMYTFNPIFDDAEVTRLIALCVRRLSASQNSDGGWGWWPGYPSSPFMTATILEHLATARQHDVKVDTGSTDRAAGYLKSWEEGEMASREWEPSALHAHVAYVLALAGQRATAKAGDKSDARPTELIERLWTGRDKLNLYGKALFTMTLSHAKDETRARTVLGNIMQFKEENEETQVAWFRTPGEGWWYWWNSDIETNATILRALIRVEPKSDLGPRLVKWLLNNRRNGYYWGSMRDTSLCVAAMSEFVLASGEGSPDYNVTFDFNNGAATRKVRISKDNFFTYDGALVIEGADVPTGRSLLTVTKDGPGALYYTVRLSYYSTECPVRATGHELKLQRSYYRLERIPHAETVEGAQGQAVREERLRYRRVPIEDGAQVNSGDLIQVELRVASDNDYTYLAFEDMKPAGCEPVDLRSGYRRQEGFTGYMELRDEKTSFFVDAMGRGEHLLRYRLRAETPGFFHALPASVQGVYASELRANSDEVRLRVIE